MIESPQNWILDDAHSSASITPTIKKHMLTSATWSKFIGYVGVVFGALYLLMMLLYGSEALVQAQGEWSSIGVLITTFLVGALYLYLSVVLTQYGNNLRKAAVNNDVEALQVFFKKQKIFWIILGAITLFLLIAYSLSIFAVILMSGQISNL